MSAFALQTVNVVLKFAEYERWEDVRETLYGSLVCEEKQPQINPDGKVKYHRHGQTAEVSFPRYIRRVARIDKDTLSDADLEHLNNWLLSKTAKVEVIKGSAIGDHYFSHSLNSCMAGKHNSRELVSLYCENPDKVSLVVYQRGDKIGRALLWSVDGEKFLDRIYPSGSEAIEYLRKWALDRGYYVREHNRLPDESVSFYNSDDEFLSPSVNLDAPDCEVYPYVDSFHWGKVNGSRVYLTCTGRCPRSECYAFESTDGYAPGDDENYTRCDHCNCRVHIDDYYYVDSTEERVCQTCFEDNFESCYQCNYSYSTDDMESVADTCDRVCPNCACDHYDRCEFDVRLHLPDEMTETEDGQWYANDNIEASNCWRDSNDNLWSDRCSQVQIGEKIYSSHDHELPQEYRTPSRKKYRLATIVAGTMTAQGLERIAQTINRITGNPVHYGKESTIIY